MVGVSGIVCYDDSLGKGAIRRKFCGQNFEILQLGSSLV
jgi:hypothetical protein